MHDLCVVIVSHNSKRWLDGAIASVLDRAGPIALDIVVVDNGSDDAAAHVEERFPQARTVRCANHGFGHANNRAREIADARYVLFLNPDTELLTGSLHELVVAMDRRADVAAIGVRQLHADGELALTIRRFPSVTNTIAETLGIRRLPFLRREFGERVQDTGAYTRETPCDWVAGSFILARSEALEESGWFDERYFLFSEEVDLCWQLKGHGWEVLYLPEMTIRHYESDSRGSPQLQAQTAYAGLQFARKNFSRVKQVLFRISLAGRFALRVALYSTLRRGDPDRSEAMRAALSAVLSERSPFENSAA